MKTLAERWSLRRSLTLLSPLPLTAERERRVLLSREEIERAYHRGNLDHATRQYLVTLMDRVDKHCARDSAVHALLRDVVLDATSDRVGTNRHGPNSTPAAPMERHVSDADRRPGLQHTFNVLHRDAVRIGENGPSLSSVNAQVQVQSLLRTHTQRALAGAIRQVWAWMAPWLAQRVLLVPRDRSELRVPPAAESEVWNGVPVACLPLDASFADAFGATSADQALALLRRGVARMGSLMVDHLVQTELPRQEPLERADELLRVLRGFGLGGALLNGFSSGAADVLNPLHCLVELVREANEQSIPTCLSDRAWQQAATRENVEFAGGLAMFSLDCLAELEHALRQPATPETIQFLRQWSDYFPDVGRKGTPLDCNYDTRYFQLVDPANSLAPWIDLRVEQFADGQLEAMRSYLIRLGCPSLGNPFREFAERLSEMYFAIVLPHVIQGWSRPTGTSRSSTSTPTDDAMTDTADQGERKSTVTESPQGGEEPSLVEQGYREVRYDYTPVFYDILQHLQSSVVVTTYQAGKLLVLGAHGGKLQISFLDFDQPMGFAVGHDRLAVGTRRQIHFLKAAHETAPSITPPGTYDGCFLPRTSFYTGAVHGHDLAFGKRGLWVVNTLFSCLCTLHEAYSFVPNWTPPFISELADQDRCHLNGLAMRNGEPRFVTALAESNEPAGWRPHKVDGGVIMEVPSGEFVARGLSMPHSPRLRGDQLWVLNSGHGSLGTIDLPTGRYDEVESMPGYTRGLAFAGQFAFVGLSKIRETAIFGGVPIAKGSEPLRCGIGIVDLASGRTVAVFQFLSGVEEIFAVDVIPGIRCPFISGASVDLQQREVWIVPPPSIARTL